MRNHLIHRRIRHSLTEGSTWASISAALVGMATQAPDGWKFWIIGAATGAAIMGALLRDKGAD